MAATGGRREPIHPGDRRRSRSLQRQSGGQRRVVVSRLVGGARRGVLRARDAQVLAVHLALSTAFSLWSWKVRAYDQGMAEEESLEVRVIGDDVSYSDSAEGELLEILACASDRSSQSDELAARIHDWPTRYHLSPLRAHLLTPLAVSRGDRVLEVGCGTGVNIRVMAEQGASVVGIEGTHARATVAKARNAEFDSVEIFAGDIAEFATEELFDFVLVVGVLEYVSSGIGGISNPVDFLRRCASFLKPDGLLVLAIENQMGVKYLLSFPEDHLGVPWIGLEGYRQGQPRTWSRVALRDMLMKVGLVHQEFLHPYPDYKLPTAIVRERVYESESGREMIKNFIRRPVVDYSGSPQYVCDVGMAFGQLVDAGMGLFVPNSFLILASKSQEALVRRVDDADAWLASAQRRSQFRNFRRVIQQGETFRVEGSGATSAKVHNHRSEWLVNKGQSESAVHRGRPLEDQIVRAFVNSASNEVAGLIRAYREFLVALSMPGPVVDELRDHPFAPRDDEMSIPGTLIDCVPQNLIVSPSGQFTLVDDEWEADGPCSIDLVFLRGLLTLATRLVEGGLCTQSSKAGPASIMDVVIDLAGEAGVTVHPSMIDRLLRAEFGFQELVLLPQPDDFNSFRDSLITPGANLPDRAPTLRLIEAATERERVLRQITELHSEWVLIDDDRRRIVAARDREQVEMKQQLEALHHEREQYTSSELHLRREIDALRLSSSYRIGRALTSPIRLARVFLRRLQG